MVRDKGASSFDELAIGLSNGTLSRGKALRLMGAALVGGALASIPGIAWAKPKPEGAKCKRNKQCASGQCVDDVCGGGEPCGGCRADCDCVVDRVSGEQACVVSCAACPCQLVTDCNDCFTGAVCFGEGPEFSCARRCTSQCQSACECPTPDNQCQRATCTNGVCGVENVPDGTSCNDVNACTIDVCTAGVCVSTAIECCGDPCTTDDDCCDGATCSRGGICTA